MFMTVEAGDGVLVGEGCSQGREGMVRTAVLEREGRRGAGAFDGCDI